MTPPRLALLLGLAAAAAVAAPLLTYSLSLAGFGLAHVVVELGVLDRRYRPRLAAHTPVMLALAAVFGVRCAANLGVLPRGDAHVLELLAGLATIVAMLPWLRRRGPSSTAVAVGGALALGAGVVFAPLTTLLVLAVLHNLAPWPLVADAVAPAQRRAVWRVGAVAFVAAPLLIASGLPYAVLARVGALATEATVLPTGPLFEHFGAFWGPPALAHPLAALHVFSACVYLQCAHYVTVLIVLPAQGPTRLPSRWVGTAVAAGLVVAVAYAVDFAAARAWYGTVAGVHAWAEFPALLLVLGGWRGRAAAHSQGDGSPAA